MAEVYKPGSGKRDKRMGRGFSLGELKEAGLTIRDAKKMGIYIDERRKTVHPQNVERLRKILGEG